MRLVCLLMVLIIYIGIEAANIPINMDSGTVSLKDTNSNSLDTALVVAVQRNCFINHLGMCIETNTIINAKYLEFESDNPTTEESSSRQKSIHESSAIELNCPKDHRGRCIETSTIIDRKYFASEESSSNRDYDDLLYKIFYG
ncbi:uncharacterized protein LOC105211900 isoform X2 [Zeugodacus cucurbitae]|uniref:uncharacterized protein LOC105211900 isoform X2 n=1 Tax=Zeugodacus cucurbitae TaxID=28588 RepID=UPI0023D95218|nr:uncharacterized protein LOC105211900 isoform X2 [Zeugodacus cucurbitae]